MSAPGIGESLSGVGCCGAMAGIGLPPASGEPVTGLRPESRMAVPQLPVRKAGAPALFSNCKTDKQCFFIKISENMAIRDF